MLPNINKKATHFYLLDYISLRSISKCSDREKKLNVTLSWVFGWAGNVIQHLKKETPKGLFIGSVSISISLNAKKLIPLISIVLFRLSVAKHQRKKC